MARNKLDMITAKEEKTGVQDTPEAEREEPDSEEMQKKAERRAKKSAWIILIRKQRFSVLLSDGSCPQLNRTVYSARPAR